MFFKVDYEVLQILFVCVFDESRFHKVSKISCCWNWPDHFIINCDADVLIALQFFLIVVWCQKGQLLFCNHSVCLFVLIHLCMSLIQASRDALNEIHDLELFGLNDK